MWQKSSVGDKSPKEEPAKKSPPGAAGLPVNQLAGVLQQKLPAQKEVGRSINYHITSNLVDVSIDSDTIENCFMACN